MAEGGDYNISPTNRSGLIIIVAALFMSWMVLVSLTRIYIRLMMNGPFGQDDFAAISAGVGSLRSYFFLCLCFSKRQNSRYISKTWYRYWGSQTWEQFWPLRRMGWVSSPMQNQDILLTLWRR